MKQPLIIDSGAAETVLPNTWFTEYPLKESEGLKEGRWYTTADGSPIYNEGERTLEVSSFDGAQTRKMTFQVADVNAALVSASNIVNSGNRIVMHLGEYGNDLSYVENKRAKERMWMRQRNGVYVLDVLVGPPGGFPEAWHLALMNDCKLVRPPQCYTIKGSGRGCSGIGVVAGTDRWAVMELESTVEGPDGDILVQEHDMEEETTKVKYVNSPGQPTKREIEEHQPSRSYTFHACRDRTTARGKLNLTLMSSRVTPTVSPSDDAAPVRQRHQRFDCSTPRNHFIKTPSRPAKASHPPRHPELVGTHQNRKMLPPAAPLPNSRKTQQKRVTKTYADRCTLRQENLLRNGQRREQTHREPTAPNRRGLGFNTEVNNPMHFLTRPLNQYIFTQRTHTR